MNSKQASDTIESIRKVYNTVATPFIASRKKEWGEFAILKDYIQPQHAVLDAGCAHGRLIPYLKKLGVSKEHYKGIDISEELIREARKTYPEYSFQVGNVLNLPYENDSFDVVLSSAVLHHIPTWALRSHMIREALRVTKTGGVVIFLVWNAFHFKHLWRQILWSYMKSVLTFGRHEAGDMYLPFFGNKNKRYVHAFNLQELRRLFSHHSSPEIQSSARNFIVVIKKL